MIALLFSAVLGFVNGARTFAPAAVAAWAAWLGGLDLAGTWLAWLGTPWAVAILTLLTIAEKIGDKHPDVPHRVTASALAARAVSAAVAGGAIAAPAGLLVAGAIVGAVASFIGTQATYRLRAWAAERMGRDLHAALIEDALVLVVAIGTVLIAF